MSSSSIPARGPDTPVPSVGGSTTAWIAFSDCGATPHERLLGHHPVILERWRGLEAAFFGSATFTGDLREQVRRTLAFETGCQYCMAKGRPADRSELTIRTSLAAAFAQLVSTDPLSMDRGQIAVLREEFTDAEIAELTALVCFLMASQTVGAVLGLAPWPSPGPRQGDLNGVGQ